MNTYKWDELPADQLSADYVRKLVFGENLVVSRITGKAGAHTEAHVHDNEEMLIVLEGAWRFTLPSGDVTVRAGEVLSIPAGVQHSSEVLEDTVALDVCTPGRADWRSGEDRHLHNDYLWAV